MSDGVASTGVTPKGLHDVSVYVPMPVVSIGANAAGLPGQLPATRRASAFTSVSCWPGCGFPTFDLATMIWIVPSADMLPPSASPSSTEPVENVP